jgi:6-phosphogluconolactonase (cycloisomerase 2 family)
MPSNGIHLYVAAGASDGIASFLRNPATGALSQLSGMLGCVTEDGTGGLCNEGKALLGARDVVLSPTGNSLYVAAPASDAVAAFERDQRTGALLQLGGTGGCVSETGTAGACAHGVALNGARAIAVTKNGKSLYVASRDSDAVAAFARDRTTGVLTQLAGTAACVSENGTGGLCVNGVALDTPNGIAVSRDGKSVYVASVGSHAVAVFARDKTTGVLTQPAGTAACVSEDGTGGVCADGRGLLGAFAVAVSPNGKNVYVAARDANAIAVFDRDRATGALTQLAGTEGCVSETGSGGECADGRGLTGVVSLTVNRDGKNLYAASEVDSAVAAFARDRATGALAQLAGTFGCVSDTGSAGACGDGTALAEARAVIATRNGRHVYVAAATSDAVAVFDRD